MRPSLPVKLFLQKGPAAALHRRRGTGWRTAELAAMCEAALLAALKAVKKKKKTHLILVRTGLVMGIFLASLFCPSM